MKFPTPLVVLFQVLAKVVGADPYSDVAVLQEWSRTLSLLEYLMFSVGIWGFWIVARRPQLLWGSANVRVLEIC